jgi:nucleoside-diphosphate-sugar epimerase
MKILILGGSGFVSGTLAQLALSRGHQVWTLTRGQRVAPKGVVALRADRHDAHRFDEVILGANNLWDLVVDCIGFVPADARQDIATFRERARQLVFISSDFVFDPARRRFPQPEEADAYATAGYGGEKRRCELEFLQGDTGAMEWTILRSCHIYGPGSLLGCLPEHGRDSKLIETLRAGTPLRLVGGGHFLQQPIFSRDLASLILSVAGNAKAHRQVLCCAGPDIIESREYYRIIAQVLGVELKIEELPVGSYLAAHPDAAPFLCHRIYDFGKIRAAGLTVPSTPIREGLREHALSLLGFACR